MVRHESSHDRDIGSLRQTRARVVQCFVEPIAAEGPDRGKPLEIAGRCLRIDHCRESRRVGCNHHVLAQATFEAQTRHAEVGVLIGQLQIAGAVSGLRNAPGHAERIAIADLPAHDQAAGLLQQAAGRRSHDQRGHQILEHRS